MAFIAFKRTLCPAMDRGETLCQSKSWQDGDVKEKCGGEGSSCEGAEVKLCTGTFLVHAGGDERGSDKVENGRRRTTVQFDEKS